MLRSRRLLSQKEKSAAQPARHSDTAGLGWAGLGWAGLGWARLLGWVCVAFWVSCQVSRVQFGKELS
eukprot:scaffold268_cov210-Ochromonas_danica.AAC.33